jgi:hypothetical protein
MSPGEESPDSPSGKEPRFDLRLVGFDNITTNTIGQLQQALGISPSRARALVDRIPSVVGRRVDRPTAFRLVTALREIGAHIAVNERPSGRAIDPAELSSPEFSSAGDAGPTSPILGRDLASDLQLGWPDEREPSGTFPVSAPAPDDWDEEGGEDEGDDLFRAFERPRRSTPQPRRSVTSLPQDLLRTVRLGEAAAALAAATSGEYPAIQPGREGSGQFTAVEAVDLEVVDDEPPPPMPRFLGKLPDFEGTDWRPFWEAPVESSLSPGDDELRAAEGDLLDDEVDDRSPRRVTGPQKPTGGRSLLVGIVVGAAVIGLLAVFALLPSGVGEGSLERLEDQASRRLPGFELVEAADGEVVGLGQSSLEESLRAGSCYGWIALADDDAVGCDLDLELVGDEGVLDRDAGADSRPVVFHCAAQGEELRVVLKNVGSEACPYLLGRYRRLGSHTFPVDPYLELYTARLVAAEDLPSRRPEGNVFHGQLDAGTAEQTLVAIPANSCRQILAVSPQGTNLDLRLRVDGSVVSEHNLPNNHPSVDYCSADSEVLAELELRMVAGSGPFAWQVFSSQYSADRARPGE